MKKILIIIGILFLVPVAAQAKSGACSGHGGVSCSAGRDSDGSVICNDGWKGSSVSYSSMVMCQGYDVPNESEVQVTAPVKQIAPVNPPVSVPVVTPKPEEKKKAPEVKNETKLPTSIVSTTTIKVNAVANSAPIQPEPKKKGLFRILFNFFL